MSTLITVLVTRRSQANYARQWKETGELNAHIEEFITGHEVIKAFGQQGRAAGVFARSNDRLERAAARAQFSAGLVQPFVQFSRLFTQPVGQVGGMLTLIQSCVASAARVFALLDTGAGKSTVVNLLLRFCRPDSGRITRGGVELGATARDRLRARFGVLLQDTWLFGGTIRDNIAYGNPEAPEEATVMPPCWRTAATP